MADDLPTNEEGLATGDQIAAKEGIPVAQATPDVKETVYGYRGDSTPDYNSVVRHVGDHENQLSATADHQSVALTTAERQRIFPDVDPSKSTDRAFLWKGKVYYDNDTAPEGDYRIDVFNPDHPPDHITLKAKRDEHYSALSSRALFGHDYSSYEEPSETQTPLEEPEQTRKPVIEEDSLISPDRMIKAVRSEYPEYANVPDSKLYKAFTQKFPTGLAQFRAVSPKYDKVPDEQLLKSIHQQFFSKLSDDEFTDVFNPPTGIGALWHSVTEQFPRVISGWYEGTSELAKFPERVNQQYAQILDSVTKAMNALGILPKQDVLAPFKPTQFQQNMAKGMFQWGQRQAAKGKRFEAKAGIPTPSGANISGQIAAKGFQGIGELPAIAPAFIGGNSVAGLVLGMTYDYIQGSGRAREKGIDHALALGAEGMSYRALQQWLLYTPRGRVLSGLLWGIAGIADQQAQGFISNPEGELKKAFTSPANYVADLVSTGAVNAMFGALASMGADALKGPEKTAFDEAVAARERGDYRAAAQLMDKTYALLPEGPRRAAVNNLLAWRNEAIEARPGDVPMEQPGQRGFLVLAPQTPRRVSSAEILGPEPEPYPGEVESPIKVVKIPRYSGFEKRAVSKEPELGGAKPTTFGRGVIYHHGPNGFTDQFFYSGIDIGKALEGAYDMIAELFTPEHRTKAREVAGAAIGKQIGEMQRENQQFATSWYRKQHLENNLKFAYEAQQRESFWNGFSEGQLKKFFELHEAQKSTGNPVVDRMFELHDGLMQAISRMDQRRGFLYDLRDSYIYHLLEKEDLVKLQNEILRRGWGDPNFMHAREIPTVEMLHALGYKLKTYNLELLDQMRMEASNRAEMRASALEGLNQTDPMFPLAFSRLQMTKLEKENPKLAAQIRTQMAPQVWRSPRAVGENDMHNTYWVHKDADFMLHRATDPVMWHPVVGVAVSGLSALKQRTVGLNLSWSMYHQLHMLPIGAADSLSHAFSRSLAKTANLADWSNAVGDALSFGAYGHTKSLFYNQKLLNWYFAEDTKALKDLSPYEQRMFYLQQLGGFVPLISHERQIQIGKWIMHNAAGKVSDKALDLGYTILSSRPYQQWLFGRAIPSMKMFSYDRAALALLDARPELNRPVYQTELMVELRKIRDQVDARYGEQNLRQSFTDPHVKAVGQALMLSYSWLKSFFDVYGGGIHDMTRFIKDRPEKPQATNRISYLLTLSAVTTATNMLIAHFIGAGVQSLQDLFYPNIGQDKNGKLERVKPPFWLTTEIGGAAHDIEQMGGNVPMGLALFFNNKLQPALSTIAEFIANKDYFGTDISPAWDSKKDFWANFMEQTWTKAEHVLRQSSSFTLQAGLKPGATSKDMLLQLLGLPRAPAYAERTAMENRIIRDYIEYDIPKGKRRSVQDQLDVRRQYRQALQDGDMDAANAARQKLVDLGTSTKSIQDIEKKAHETEAERLFDAMKAEEQKIYWKDMSLKEKQEFWPYLHKDLKKLYIDAYNKYAGSK